MLDDHILKAQTMRGSPYVKAFEEEMQQWEEKLISIQDIIDAWLAVRNFTNKTLKIITLFFSASLFGCTWNRSSAQRT